MSFVSLCICVMSLIVIVYINLFILVMSCVVLSSNFLAVYILKTWELDVFLFRYGLDVSINHDLRCHFSYCCRIS